MAVTQKVTLYNNKFTVPPVINAVQNDTDRQVEAYFGDFTLQVGMTGKLSFIRSDGTHYEVSATLNTGANTATAELDQALTQAGVTQAQLKITDSGNVGSTFTFMIKVQPDVAGISVEQDGWSAQEFDQRLTDAENAIDAVEEDVADLQEKEYDYAPVITDTASGAIASFQDGADGYPLRECVVDVDAVQDLHGYDNPWPAGGNKNLLPNEITTATEGGLTFTTQPNGKIKVSGTTSKSIYATDICENFSLPAGEYIFSYDPVANLSVNICNRAENISYLDIGSGAPSKTLTVTQAMSNDMRVRFIAHTALSVNGETGVMIRLATESDATFAPYSNECPISGWSEAKVTRTGKNLLPKARESATMNGITWTLNEDGSITVVGTSTGRSYIRVSIFNRDYFKLPIGTYTYSLSPTGSDYDNVYSLIGSYYPNNSYAKNVAIASSSTNWSQTFVWDASDAGLRFDIAIEIRSANQTVNCIIYPQIEVGSAKTAYEPYNGQTFTISLGDTRYGAELDVTRGKLRVTHKAVDLGSLEYTYASNYQIFTTVSITDAKVFTGMPLAICSMFNGVTWAQGATDPTKNGIFCGLPEYNQWRFRDLQYSDPDVFKTAVTGQALVYELATPIEVDVTPTEISALLGTNNVWADTGNIAVEYCADTKKYIQKVISALA